MPRNRILIFAKEPVPGQVKTRLIPALGREKTTDLYILMLRDALTRACGVSSCEVTLYCSPASQSSFFTSLAAEFSVALKRQCEGNLGARMADAARTELGSADSVLLIGTDTPGLSTSYMDRAIKLLQTDKDAVLGPAEDGGYVMLALNKYAAQLFSKIPWSSPAVAEVTRNRLNELGWQWGELEELWDVDRPEDLQRINGLDGLGDLVL